MTESNLKQMQDEKAEASRVVAYTGGFMNEYTNWMDECMSWHKTCYIGDWTGILSRQIIKGSDALEFCKRVFVNSMENYAIGQAKHGIACDNNGNLISEGILMRLGEDEFCYQVGPTVYWVEHRAKEYGDNINVEDYECTNFQVSGPNALAIIEKVSGESLKDVKFMNFKKIMIEGIEVYALRQGMAGEIGFELMAPIQHHQKLYTTILSIGQEFGIRQLGMRAFGMNHIENGFFTSCIDYMPAMFSENEDNQKFKKLVQQKAPYMFEGLLKVFGSANKDNDYKRFYRNPVEFGWGRNIKFDHDFIGHTALEKIKSDPKRKAVTLVWNVEDVIEVFRSLFEEGEIYRYMEFPRHSTPGTMYADVVLKGDKEVGVATNRGYTVNFRKMISLCTIDIEYSEPGTKVEILWGLNGQRQKKIRATVAQLPYKENRNKTTDLTKL